MVLLVQNRTLRVCQEAGARVGRNVALSAMNLDVPIHDARRIEVVCNGLPLWHGAQLAVDATLVSPFSAAGGAAWSCLGLRSAAAGTPKPPPSFACSREPAPLPRLLRSASALQILPSTPP